MVKNKILIAEDNFLNAKLMFDILTSQGFVVDVVSDGEAAMTKLTENDYDLFLLDLQMPIISGFDVLASLKETKNSIKTVVVSACAMSEEIEKAKALGCIDFITKPIRLYDFLNVVKKHLE